MMSGHHLRYGRENDENIAFEFFLDYPTLNSQLQHLYELYLMIIVKTSSPSSRYGNIHFKTCFLFFFINWVGVVISLDCHYNILEYS